MTDSRNSLLTRVGRVVQRIPLWPLQFMEKPFVDLVPAEYLNDNEIFIFALPRGGSTLAYQVLCHGLDVNYLSNIWNLVFQMPFFGSIASGYLTRTYQSDFRSDHGFVGGLNGPAEGLAFWRWWMGCGLSDETCGQMAPKKIRRRTRYLRRVFARVEPWFGPFVSAYLGHTLVPDRLHEEFPNAKLIRIRRDPVSNALSLLTAMRVKNANWFSIFPSQCSDSIHRNECERVAHQVYWLNRRLDDAKCCSKMLIVRYEDICSDPMRELNRIQRWCASGNLTIRERFPLPEEFTCKIADPELDEDAHRILCALRNLESRYGELSR